MDDGWHRDTLYSLANSTVVLRCDETSLNISSMSPSGNCNPGLLLSCQSSLRVMSVPRYQVEWTPAWMDAPNSSALTENVNTATLALTTFTESNGKDEKQQQQQQQKQQRQLLSCTKCRARKVMVRPIEYMRQIPRAYTTYTV